MSIRLAAEHCTLAPNVKAGDVKPIYFSIECVTGRRPANAAFAFSQYLFAAGIRTKCAASRRENRVGCLVLRTSNRSRAFAQPCRSRCQENLGYVITSTPDRRRPQQRAQWDQTDGRSI